MTPNVWEENKIDSYCKDDKLPMSHPLHPQYSIDHGPFCPLCHKSIGNTYSLPPLRREIHLAKPYFGDLINSSLFVYFSERAKKLYEESDLKGVEEFRKIEILRVVTHNGVRKAKLPPCPTYYLADITVDGAIMDYKRSKAVLCPPIGPLCEYCTRPLSGEGRDVDKYTGLYIDESRWNKNNIFYLLGIGGTNVVDQKFKDWFEDNHLVNASSFVPEAESTFNAGLYKSYVKEYKQEGIRYDLD